MLTREVVHRLIHRNCESVNEESLVLHFGSGESARGKLKGGWMELSLVCLSDAVDPSRKVSTLRTEVTMKWSPLIMVLVLVIAVASVATAGSAWVLWNEYVKFERQLTAESTVKFWDVLNAFEERQQY